ncbi:MAG TPA: nuclear transport factor 2 family protein [Ignavibacteriales bacterium]|nr:nuclear transport factor 2 family protein [Ignavibacteriales bacterium]
MKSFNLVAILLVFTISVFAKSPVSPEDETAIKQTIENFVKGTDSRNVSMLEKVFYEDASFVGVNKINKSFVNSNNDEYIDLVKKGRMGGWQREFNVASLDANDQTAMAKVEITDSKLKQTEYLTLVKVDGAWKIVNRTYTVESNK